MMYVHVWNKYLPIIKILIKKSKTANQTLSLNKTDFDKAGIGRKAGYKFSIDFFNGKVTNVISGVPLASDLALALTTDAGTREVLADAELTIQLNTKFQLLIINRKVAANQESA